MKKLLAWCLLISLLVIPVSANGYETVEFQEETVLIELPSQVYLSEPAVFEGTRYETQLSGKALEYYQILKNSELGTNPTEDTVFTVAVDLGVTETWENVTFTRSEVGGVVSVDQQVIDEMDEYCGEQALYVAQALSALTMDEPELSWLNQVYFVVGRKTGGSVYWSLEDPLVGTGKYSITSMSFRIAEESLEAVSETGTMADFTAALEAAQAELEDDDGEYDIDALGMNRYEKVRVIHEYVCDTVSYANGDLTLRKYQTVYSAMIDPARTTVCAGYAKMVKVLCDAYGIPCVLITGESFDEPHMWNYVQMIDGNWYGLDATWDDDVTEVGETYFLQGSDRFDEEHLPIVNWSQGLALVYPELAASAYLPVPELTISTVNGAQIRTSGNQGLRFISSIQKSGDFGDVKEYGILLIPSADLTDLSELVIGATLNGHEVAKVPAKNLYAVTDDTVTFTAVITNIKEKNYAREYTARAYAILADDTVVYSDVGASRSIYAVAKKGLASASESEANKAIFQAIVDAVEGTEE